MNSIWVFVVGVGASALALAGVAFGRYRKIEVPREAVGDRVPSLLVLDRSVSLLAGQEAAEWWRSRGHQIDVIWSTGAARGPLNGQIWVEVNPAKVDDREGGRECTDTRYNEDKTSILWASISVRRADDALMICHGMGHALGYHHPANCPAGHMMHPSKCSWDDDRGLSV